jgi:hypothetical protein
MRIYRAIGRAMPKRCATDYGHGIHINMATCQMHQQDGSGVSITYNYNGMWHDNRSVIRMFANVCQLSPMVFHDHVTGFFSNH